MSPEINTNFATCRLTVGKVMPISETGRSVYTNRSADLVFNHVTLLG